MAVVDASVAVVPVRLELVRLAEALNIGFEYIF
jgi:hypothetical protein